MSDLPPGWSRARLDALATVVQYGSSAKTSDNGDGVPVLRMGNIIEGRLDLENLKYLPANHDEFPALFLSPGDLLFNRTNSPELVGKTAVYTDEHPAPCSFASYLIRLRLRHYEPALAAAYLNSPMGRAWVRTCVTQQVGQANVSGGRLKELELPVPPLPEQRRIVEKLETLRSTSQRARSALDAVPSLLEKLRQSILAAAFRGDLTKEWRAKNPDVEPVSKVLRRTPKPPLPSRAKSKSIAVLPGDFGLSVGDPGAPTPRGWKWVSLIDVARLESGHTPSRHRPEWWGGKIPWLGIKDARDHHGRTITETRQTTNADGLANSAARLLPKGTVCLSRTATIGYVTVMGEAMATSQDFVNWVCTDAVEPHWLKLLFIAEKQALLRYSSQSTNVATIFYPELLSFHVCLPPPDEQREIVRRVELLMASATRLEQAHGEGARLLSLVTTATLAKAFRGEFVPQDPNDEPADAMLAGLRAPLDDTPAAVSHKRPTRRARKSA